MIKTKTRQLASDFVKHHAGNSNYVVHTYQICITVFTTQLLARPDCKCRPIVSAKKGLLKLKVSGVPSIETLRYILKMLLSRRPICVLNLAEVVNKLAKDD